MIQKLSRSSLDGRLAAYMAAVGAAAASSTSQAAVVGNSTVQPFGVNQDVSIDFNNDGQTDFQIDHDRVNLSGNDLDYLQIDKNDVNSAANPLPFDPLTGFQAQTFADGVTPRNDANKAGYVTNSLQQGSYPAARSLGDLIGPTAIFDWQESDNFGGGGKDIRANRLIDEDATQIDQVLGGQPASGVQEPFNGPNFVGLAPGEVRYVGLKMELNNTSFTNYGWIGIRIDDEASATGAVVGYGYETLPGVPITAGNVPEPSTMLLGALSLLGVGALRYVRGK